VVALTNIELETNQQQVDMLMGAYLPSYGQHVDSISLQVISWEEGSAVTLRQLPATLTKLSSLTLWSLYVQLQPGDGYQGVLSAAAAPCLKQLQVIGCRLLDGEEGLGSSARSAPWAAAPLYRGL
jgi:hypothetical protein